MTARQLACPACARHVRVSETRCSFGGVKFPVDFGGARLILREPPRWPWRQWLLGALALAQGAFAAASGGCSGEGTHDEIDATESDASVGPPPRVDAGPDTHEEPVTPPAPPPDAATTSTTTTNFALHELFLGDTDFDGKADYNAWEQFGYNIDGKITTAESTNVCRLVNNGGSFGLQAQVDGKGGIDNSFGANVYPGLILGLDTKATTHTNASIAGGAATAMIDIVGLTSSPTQSATGLSAQAFAGAPFSGTPTWTIADDWPVLTSSVTGASLPFTSVEAFPDAYVVSGTWVTGPPGDFTVPFLSIGDETFFVTVHHAVVTFQHATATHAAGGIISGVLNTQDFLSVFKVAAARFTSYACETYALASLLEQIEDSQDIRSDGTNPPGVACDAISIGLGFTADEIGPPTTLFHACPPSDPCFDAGADADASPCHAGIVDSGVADVHLDSGRQ
jgi:hypothetical protein